MDRFRCRMFANDSSRSIPGNRCLRPGHEGHLPDEPRTMYVTIQLVHFLKSFKNVWCNEISVLTLYAGQFKQASQLGYCDKPFCQIWQI